ncbi:hypothetical protein JCM24511_01732 [Saitozyma sp. JCM 24511]|nr:hypothetical protein JCM24511_01732 [Saitozyma sp. JCM 24511]
MSSEQDTEAPQVVIDWRLIEDRTVDSSPGREHWTHNFSSILIDKNDRSESLFRFIPARDDRPDQPDRIILSSGGLNIVFNSRASVGSMKWTAIKHLSDMRYKEDIMCAAELNTCYVYHQLSITPTETLKQLSGKSAYDVLQRSAREDIISFKDLEPTIQAFSTKLHRQTWLSNSTPLPREWEAGRSGSVQ